MLFKTMRVSPISYCLAVLSLIFLSACGISSPSKSGNSKPAKVVLNALTNLPGGNGPVLVVKIDDTAQAHPQLNIASADVVYIEQVEGGLTRIAAVYSNPKTLPELIGPVRSARISDLDLLAQYGHVAFAFSGAQRKFLPEISKADLENLSAEINPPSIYSRDLARSEPTAMILHPKLLLTKTIDTEKKTIVTAKSVGWTFGKAPIGGTPIASVAFSWPASKYGASWSAAEKRWLLTYQGKPDMDSSGFQLGSPTLVIQKVSITPSIYHDKVGGVTPFSNTVGSGSAYLLRDGQMFPIFWNRASKEMGTTWTTKDGQRANFAPGQLWIALTDQNPTFTHPAPQSKVTSQSPHSASKGSKK